MQHSKSTGASKAYPFRTRRQIAGLIQGNRAFARECIEIMVSRQFAKQSGTAFSSAMGWGSSDASRVTKPAQRIVDGIDTDGDWEEVLPILVRYTKQLAQYWRDQQLTAHPDLAEVAALYGVSIVARQSSDADHAGPAPRAAETQPVDAVGALLPPTPVPAFEAVTSKAEQQLSPLDEAIISYLTLHERGTTTEVAKRTRNDRAAVLEALRQMHARGTVVRTGVGRGTSYSLSGAPESALSSQRIAR